MSGLEHNADLRACKKQLASEETLPGGVDERGNRRAVAWWVGGLGGYGSVGGQQRQPVQQDLWCVLYVCFVCTSEESRGTC